MSVLLRLIAYMEYYFSHTDTSVLNFGLLF